MPATLRYPGKTTPPKYPHPVSNISWASMRSGLTPTAEPHAHARSTQRRVQTWAPFAESQRRACPLVAMAGPRMVLGDAAGAVGDRAQAAIPGTEASVP